MQAELENRLHQEKEDIGRRILILEEERSGLVERAKALTRTSGTILNEISVVEERLKSRRGILKEIRDEYERTSSGASSDATREAGLNKESGYLNKRIEEITDSSSRLEKEKGDVNLKTENLLSAFRKKNEIRNALTQKLEAIERDILEKERICEDLERVRKGTEGDLKSAETELNVCQTRLSSLKSLAENFEGYKVGVRTIMKAKDLKARNEGRVLGLVADMIQVEPKYEQSVEAVLADKLQYVIVEKQEDGKEAVDYLKSRSKGRSSFVSLRDLTGKEGIGNNNGFPLLRDLVRVSDAYKPLIDLLLGDTALVENLEQAISVWRDNGKDHTLVTPEGDMIDNNGIISGGKLANGAHGILSRRREIKELEKNTAGFIRKVEEFKIRLEGIGHEADEKKISLNDLKKERLDCQDTLNDLDKVIFRLSHELDQIESLSERISRELEQKTKEQAGHRNELNRIESELKLYGDKKRKKEEYLLKKRLELKESEESLMKFATNWKN